MAGNLLSTKQLAWSLWIVSTLLLLSWLGFRMLGEDKSLYLSGDASNGHYQIEQKCELCHTQAFGGAEVIQDACVECHAQELKQADDSHPKSKFTDPRNAELVNLLDARYCGSCHVEHQPRRTRVMGVTLPEDYCFRCHQDVGKDRPSHKDLPFDGCASAGCHNYHDNRALYEDFLVKYGQQHEAEDRLLPARNLADFLTRQNGKKTQALSIINADADSASRDNFSIIGQWAGSAHARGAVNCSDCHKPGTSAWSEKPDTDVCQSCHKPEASGFLLGKHGMRIKAGLTPMSPAMARQPMKADAADRFLGCNSCHNPHTVDLVAAREESCLQCHNDEHSLAYDRSPHAVISKATDNENRKATCATCHLPRISHEENGLRRTLVQHNQNDNLRPNEKMIRSVCMQCHSLQFSLDSLADRELIRRNFAGRPEVRVKSIEWALTRVK